MLTQAKSKARKSVADAPKKDQLLWRPLLSLLQLLVLDLEEESSEYEYYSYYSPALICPGISPNTKYAQDMLSERELSIGGRLTVEPNGR